MAPSYRVADGILVSMELENIVFDALDPRLLGMFWQDLPGCSQLTDSAEGFETRLFVENGPTLDFCFQPVEHPTAEHQRLRLRLNGGSLPEQVMTTALGLGASRPVNEESCEPGLDLRDPQNNAFGIAEESSDQHTSGAVAAITIESASPARDAEFWAWLSGWDQMKSGTSPTLQHPSGRGFRMEFIEQRSAKSASKNRIHLDVRLSPGDDPDRVAAEITTRGGAELHPDWGTLPWRVYQDPSGNEFCVLPAPSRSKE